MPYPEVEIPPMPREVFSHKDLDSCFNNPPCFYYFWRLSKGVKHVHLTPAGIQQISLLQEMYLCTYRLLFNLPHPMNHIRLMTGPGGLEDRHVPFCVATPLSPQLPLFNKGSTISVSWVSTTLFCSMFSAVIYSHPSY